ncbi:GtrA family protein [Lactococcus taiwanensis]|jgi:putative flippase GtrA|uniref:GtrA family protein n=1 Tax=Lactococcus taiwanensis TaxID=1151742 RepID=A0AA45QSE4_9LACT|nr:GtrA family protein [Lactococcus taiwanensis]QSE77336.1 GtrA family protein [Lactococcus taiwanensis]
MKKLKYFLQSETLRYIIFGVLATAVYALVKWLSWQAWHSGWASETVAQSCSILFAFVTNKIFVFHHKSDQLLRDFISFVSGRIVLLLLAIVINWWFVDQHPQLLMNLFGLSKNRMVAELNVFIQVLTIVLNYLYSKFFVFKNKKNSAS